MERDWGVIREILLRLEAKGPDKHDLRAADFDEDRRDIIAYHVQLLAEVAQLRAQIGPAEL